MADENITIGVDLNDNFSARARVVVKSIDDIGDKSASSKPKVDGLGSSIDDLGDNATQAAGSVSLAERRVKALGNESVKSAAKVGILAKMLDRLSMAGGVGGRGGGSMPGGFFGGIFNGGRKLRVFLMFTLIPVIGDAVGALATLGGAAAALGAAGVGGLAPLVGVLIAIPGYLGAIIQGFGAVALGFAGMGEVMKTMMDPAATAEELDKAIKSLAPNARKLAKEIVSLKKPLTAMRKEVQNELAPGFTNLVKTFRGYIPLLRESLVGTAGVVSRLASSFASFLGQTQTQRQIGKILQDNAGYMDEFGSAAISGLEIILDLLVAAGPMLTRMAQDIAKFMDMVAEATSRNGQNIEDFFNKSYEVAKKVTKFITDLTVGLYQIFRQGADLGGEIGDSFLDMAAKFREYTESARGQQEITGWFQQMKPVIYEVGYLLRDIGKVLAGLSMDGTLVGTLQVLRLELLPSLERFLQATSGKFIPLLAQMLSAIANIIVELDFFPVLLKGLADILTIISDIVKALPAPVKEMLGYLIAIVALMKVSGLVGSFLGMAKGMTLASGAMRGVQAGLGNVGFALASVRGGAATAGEAVKFLGRGALGTLGAGVAAIGPQLALAAVAAIGLGAWESSKAIDAARQKTDELVDSLLKTSSTQAFEGIKTQIQDLREALNSALGQNEQGDWSFFSTETWLNSDTYGDAARMVGHSLKTAFSVDNIFNPSSWKKAWGDGPAWAWTEYQDQIDEAQKAQAKYSMMLEDVAHDIFFPNDPLAPSLSETSPQLKVVKEIADTLGIDLTQGYDSASKAITEFYNVNYRAEPAVRDMYNGLKTLGDAASTAEEKVSAFRTVLDSVLSIMKGTTAREAAVQTAKGFDQLAQSFEGVKISFKGGKLAFDATKKANWALNDALTSQVDNLNNVAVATFQETQSVAEATAAYANQYDTLVNKTAKGLSITKDQAALLVGQYALTPEQVSTVFNTPGLATLVEQGATTQQIIDYLNGKTVTTTIDPQVNPIQTPLLPGQTVPGGPITVPVQPTVAPTAGPVVPTVDTTSIDTANTAVAALNTGLNSFNGKTYPFTTQANNLSQSKLDAIMLNTQIDRLRDKTITVTTNYRTTGTPPRAMGGPVDAGQKYLVGEIGPEAYVSGSGHVSLIGARGPEVRAFPSDGYIIPNHMLGSVQSRIDSDDMNSLTSALATRTSSRSSSGSGEYQIGGSPVVHIGTINAQSEFDVIKAVKKGIAEAERNRRERS